MQQNFRSMPMPPSPQAPHYWKPKNGFGTTGLVLGVVSLVEGIGANPGPALVAAIVGLIFGILGITRASRRVATNLASAIAGTACSGIAIVMSIANPGFAS